MQSIVLGEKDRVAVGAVSVIFGKSNGNPVIASIRNDQKSIPNIVHKYRTEILGRCLSSNLLSITLTTAKLTEAIKERNIHMGA